MQTTSPPTSDERSSARRPAVALVLWLALAAIQVALAFLGAAAAEGRASEPLYRYEFAVGSALAYAFVVALTLAIGAIAYRDPVGTIGVRSFPLRWLWIALGVTVVSLIVAGALEQVLHAGERQGLAPEEWRPERAAAFVVNVAVVVLVAPFVEELFFRGLGVPALGVLGGTWAVVVTAVVFGLAHGLLVALPALVFFALGLGWVRLRSESVWPGFVAHAAYNGSGIAFLILSWTLDAPS